MELLRFYAEAYICLVKDLHDLQLCLQIDSVGNEGEVEHTRISLETAVIQCRLIGLQVSAKHAEELLQKLERNLLADADVKALHENIERELGCQFFVGIPASRIEAFTKSLEGWEAIGDKFPTAIEDIEEMSKCYALCRYSAAVFHSLMVVEHGLVYLGKILGVTDPKEGWDASSKKLASIVQDGRAKNSTGLDFAFLEQVNASVQVMKLAWRNKVNHATGKPIVMAGGFCTLCYRGNYFGDAEFSPIAYGRVEMKNKEFERFDVLARGVLSVPHSEIKAKLDEEKRAKKRKKSKKGKIHDAK